MNDWFKKRGKNFSEFIQGSDHVGYDEKTFGVIEGTLLASMPSLGTSSYEQGTQLTDLTTF